VHPKISDLLELERIEENLFRAGATRARRSGRSAGTSPPRR